ncbi:N-acetylglucosamine-6-phosphate deacetylase [Alicyclobacillus sacchari]|nr:N-acetylglucosamine-6-phosphate deacetylase [Alicyclobacillus sacchari]
MHVDRTSAFVIRNGRLVLEDSVIESGYILAEHGVIREIGYDDAFPRTLATRPITVLDAHGQWILPGFIDLHIHGGDGYEVMDGTVRSLEAISRFHARHGTTGWLPTTLTAETADVERAIQAAKRAAYRVHDGAQILGVHLEGPFISPKRCGAQNPKYIIPPSMDILERLTSVAERFVKKVTIAPEQEGALNAIRWLSTHGIIASVGHTDATFQQTRAAISAGARHATHLFNAMRGLHHREGGTVGAMLLSGDVVCELIADGHHVAPEVMNLAYRLKGRDNVVLITDAMAAAGKPDGDYQLGQLDVIVKNGVAVLKEGNHLAGSTLTMDGAIRNMVSRVGIHVRDAAYMASTVNQRTWSREYTRIHCLREVCRFSCHGRRITCRCHMDRRKQVFAR